MAGVERIVSDKCSERKEDESRLYESKHIDAPRENIVAVARKLDKKESLQPMIWFCDTDKLRVIRAFTIANKTTNFHSIWNYDLIWLRAPEMEPAAKWTVRAEFRFSLIDVGATENDLSIGRNDRGLTENTEWHHATQRKKRI